MAEAAEIGKCCVGRGGVAPRGLNRLDTNVFPARYGSSEISLVISASVQPRTVRVRTLPSAPLAMANLATLSPFAASTMSKRSDLPEVK